MKKVFLYFHINSFTEEIFYVGIGVGFRPYRVSGRSVLWNRIAKKYGFKTKVVQEFNTWEDAAVMEKYYIKMYGRIDNKTGVLANHTDGGEGALGHVRNVGFKHSAESNLKKSIALKGRKPHPNTYAAKKLVKQVSWNKGQKMKESSRLKMIRSRTGQKLTQETKDKIGAKMKGRKFSEETRKRISVAHKGKPKSEETKRKLSEAAKKQWKSGNTWYNAA